MCEKLTIIKIGGQVIDSTSRLKETLKNFSSLKGNKILVHGGGKKASELCNQLGITPQFIEGRRITDIDTLEVTTMVYSGLINKKIVAELNSFGCNALGLSGADLNLIRSSKRKTTSIDFGWVGDIQEVNCSQLNSFLTCGMSPVFSAITHDNLGNLLNTNADTIACELAKSLSEFYDIDLVYCFEMNGVLLQMDDPTTLLEELSYDAFLSFCNSGQIKDGMIPKLQNGFDALQHNVKSVYITNTDFLKDSTIVKTTLI